MHTIGLDREENIFISNILPWRPPGNRNPTPEETTICLPFIKRQISILKPKIIVFLGSAAAHALLDIHEGITKIRGKWYRYQCEETSEQIPAIPTFHPAYLLRIPAQKEKTWIDFLNLKKKLSSLTE